MKINVVVPFEENKEECSAQDSKAKDVKVNHNNEVDFSALNKKKDVRDLLDFPIVGFFILDKSNGLLGKLDSFVEKSK